MLKIAFLTYFSKNLQTEHSIFVRLDEKHYLHDIFEKISEKITKNVLRKLLKMDF